MKKKSIKFLNACIEQMNKLDTSEVERLKHIYKEEMERKSEKKYLP